MAAARTSVTSTPGKDPQEPPLVDPALIDEFAPLLQRKRALDAEVRVLTAEGSRYDVLNQLIREAADKKPALERLMLRGILYDIEATPKENESSPLWRKLVREFGMKVILTVATITQKAVKQLLVEKKKPESAYELFFSKARTGSRSLTVITKPKPASEAA